MICQSEYLKTCPPEYRMFRANAQMEEKATDIPSRFKGERPYINESGKDFAKRLCDEAFGKGNYDTGPKSDYNRLKKYGDRAFTNPKK